MWEIIYTKLNFKMKFLGSGKDKKKKKKAYAYLFPLFFGGGRYIFWWVIGCVWSSKS